MKSLFLIIVSMLLLLAGCGQNISPQSEINAADGNTAASDDSDSTGGEDTMDNSDTMNNRKIPAQEGSSAAKLLFQGHGSFRITTADGKVIYIDPYAGSGYDLPADLILVTHQHSDHNQINLITSKNPGCEVISEKEALMDGKQQTFDFGYVKVEAVEAGNKNHDPAQCVGYILTLDGGLQVYFSGDTSTTAQMGTFAERKLDYAILCCDGVYNMDIAEASECAALIGARYSIPCHMAPGKLFDRERAEQFEADGRLIIADGEEITLTLND